MILVLYHICRRKKRQNCEQVKRNLTPFALIFCPSPLGFHKKRNAPSTFLSTAPFRAVIWYGRGGQLTPLQFHPDLPGGQGPLHPVGLSDLEGEVRVQVQGQRRPGLAPFQDGDLPAQHQGPVPVGLEKGLLL